MKVVITDTDFSDAEVERNVLEPVGFEVVVAQSKTSREVVSAASGATALLVQYAPITAEVLRKLPELRVVSRYGVGVDTVDLHAAQERGVWVANVTDYGVEEVAAHTIAMMFALLRQINSYDREVKAGNWSRLSAGPIHRIKGLTLGVVGLGKIGRIVAEQAVSWFGRVLGYDPFVADQSWPDQIQRENLEELFSKSQVVSLHLPLSEETRALVDRSLLERLPNGSHIVNTARGGLIDLSDLLWALEYGNLAGAALDVLPKEPPEQDHPILRHPRVLLSPHVAFYSAEAEEELRRKAALNIVYWAKEGPRCTWWVQEEANRDAFSGWWQSSHLARRGFVSSSPDETRTERFRALNNSESYIT